jgi:hypothetical protein
MSTEGKATFAMLKNANEYHLSGIGQPSQDKASGHCSKDETVVTALRVKKPKRIMIDSMRRILSRSRPNKPNLLLGRTYRRMRVTKSMNIHLMLTALQSRC